VAPRIDFNEIQKLIDQTRQAEFVDEEDELLGGNEGKRRANSSAFGTLFDVLSRPSRASAGLAEAITDDDPTSSAMGGFVSGLRGKSDATYSDVLGNLGVKNPVVKAVGGFAGDVALDPLTYVGIKNVKGISGAEGRLRAVRDLTEAGQEVTVESVERTGKTLQALDPSRTYLTFGGRKVSPEFEGPANVGRGIKEAIVGPEDARRLLARVSSRRSELPFGLADEERVLESANAGIYDRHQNAIKGFFGRLTRDEQEDISRAIESGKDLSDVPVYGKARTGEFTNLGAYQKVAQKELKRFFDEEAELGLYKPDQFNSQYVYKYYKKGIKPGKPGLPAAARGGAFSTDGSSAELRNLLKTEDPATVLTLAAKRAKEYSLDEARRAGYDPAMEVGEMLGLRAAKHYRTMGRQGLVKNAVEKFGVDATDANRAFLIKNDWAPAKEYLAAPVAQANEAVGGKWIPEPIARALNSTETVLKDGQTGAQFVRWYDKIIGMWKSANTAYNPGYHVRNSMSDGIVNFMDGVTNPSLYGRAGTVLRKAKGIKDEEVLGIVEPLDSIKRIKVGKNQLTPDEMWNLYLKGGSKTGFITNDIVASLDPLTRGAVGKAVDRSKTLAGRGAHKLNQGISDMSETREDFFRLAHHIKGMEDDLKHLKGPATMEQLEQASLKAGERVRKYNIDYGQLSSVERNVMRRIIPFYGWMRRNLPLQVEMLFTKPGYMAMYPKGQDLFQGLLGTENGEGDYMVNKWVRDLAPVRLAVADNDKNTAVGKLIKKLAGAGQGEPVFANIASNQTPIGDLDTLTSPIARGVETGSPMAGTKELFNNLINMVTPAAKIPAELGTGRSTFTGQPIDDWGKWGLSQLGPTRAGSRFAEGDVRFGTSWLGGLNLQPVTADRQQGEYRRREDVVDAQIRAERARVLQENGIKPEEAPDRLTQRIRTEKIARLQKYKDNNRKILGVLTDEGMG